MPVVTKSNGTPSVTIPTLTSEGIILFAQECNFRHQVGVGPSLFALRDLRWSARGGGGVARSRLSVTADHRQTDAFSP